MIVSPFFAYGMSKFMTNVLSKTLPFAFAALTP